jgi:hypothetical protein
VASYDDIEHDAGVVVLRPQGLFLLSGGSASGKGVVVGGYPCE